MMILVDELPDTPNECLFAIHNTVNKITKPACQLMLRSHFDWDCGITFSYGENGNGCKLCFDKPCPFLRKHMYD